MFVISAVREQNKTLAGDPANLDPVEQVLNALACEPGTPDHSGSEEEHTSHKFHQRAARSRSNPVTEIRPRELRIDYCPIRP